MKTLLIAALAVTTIISPAFADETSAFAGYNPYIGVDLQRTIFQYNNNYDLDGTSLDGDLLLKDGLNGINIHAGVRPHPNFGVELGYFRNSTEEKDINTGDSVGSGTVAAADFSTKVKSSGVTLDGLAYAPMSESIDLIGTAGLSWTRAEFTLGDGTTSETSKDSELGWRIGGGAQAAVSDQVNARALIRYQSADFKDVADGSWIGTVGLNYAF